nr:hypothetical protein [Xanthomonas translucens]
MLLGAYVWGLEAFEFTSMTPQQRVTKALECGTHLHLLVPGHWAMMKGKFVFG